MTARVDAHNPWVLNTSTPSRPAVIVDVDGTLCDVSGLRDWVTGKRKDYHMFHTLSLEAPCHAWVVQQVQSLWDTGWDILIVTARSDRYMIGTVEWLERMKVPYHRLYMREAKDNRPDYVVKKNILDQIRQDGYNPYWSYDDNPNVIKLWKEEGIGVTVVPGWED